MRQSIDPLDMDSSKQKEEANKLVIPKKKQSIYKINPLLLDQNYVTNRNISG
jgi:hypothetical protein